MACNFWIIFLISIYGRLGAAESCSPAVTDGHLDLLEDIIDGQLNITCAIPMQVVGRTIIEKAAQENKMLAEYCYNKVILFHLLNLLEKLNFKPNSRNDNNTRNLKSLYYEEITSCPKIDTEEEISHCLQTIHLTPIQLLERIKDSFLIAQKFQPNSNFDSKCTELYKQCNENNDHIAGPQCACPSPASLNTQKSLSGLSELKSSTYATGFPHHSVSSVEDTSATYPYKPTSPQKNPQGLGPSSVMFTDMSTEKQTLTTIMDHSQYATTVYPEANTESTHNSMDITLITTKLPKGINGLLCTTIKPSQYNNPFRVSKDPSNSNTEGLLSIKVPPTTVIQSTNAHFLKNGELVVGTKSDDGEMLETTVTGDSSNVPISPTSLSKPTKEPAIESSSSSVTKIRRSLVDLDYTSRSTVKTPTISIEESGTNLYASSEYIGSGLSTSEFPQTVSQEKGTEDKNLGWASNYMFSSAAKVSNTGPSISPPDSEIQSLTEVPQPHFTTGYNIGYTQYISPQHKSEVAGFISDNRENNFAGPNHRSNPLPIIETEGKREEQKEQNVFITFTVILSAMVLLFLCGLLYYMFHYRLLKRRLHRDYDEQLPEERSLQIPLTDVV